MADYLYDEAVDAVFVVSVSPEQEMPRQKQ